MKIKNAIIFLLIIILFFPLILAGNYGAGTYGAGLYGVGEVPPVTPPSGGGTTGGGGGPSCYYKWECTNWFPAECPVSGIQERLCMNKGTCTGKAGMPNQTRTCAYEHKEPLFDIFLTLPSSSERVCPGEKIKAEIELKNYGKLELLDAFMSYRILDENNSLISELKDTRSVSDGINFDISMKIPDLTPPGTYKLYAEITYSGNKTAMAGESFAVNEEIYCQRPAFLEYLPYILIGIGFLIIFILIIILFRKIRYHHREKKFKCKPEKKEKNIMPKKIGFFKKMKIRREIRRREKEKARILERQEKEEKEKKELLRKKIEELKRNPAEKKIPPAVKEPSERKENLTYLRKKREVEEKWRKKKIEELKEKLRQKGKK
ncbi:MAG: hypothetical protein M1416_01855 [Candidatus Pacearchaeota archaeon]|nr:hypothetical protein [Candidatus Pacearchaeota archaeon]